MTSRRVEAAEAKKEQSGGRLAVALDPNSALGADTATLSQWVSGAVEMYMPQSYLPAPRVPAAGILGVGFAFPNRDVVWPAIDYGRFRANAGREIEHDLPETSV